VKSSISFSHAGKTKCSAAPRRDGARPGGRGPGGLIPAGPVLSSRVLSIEIPPLRLRCEDTPLLANYFRVEASARQKRRVLGITAAARDCLMRYEWPANVGELQGAIEHAVAPAAPKAFCLRICLTMCCLPETHQTICLLLRSGGCRLAEEKSRA
jgi:hypothetical protein